MKKDVFISYSSVELNDALIVKNILEKNKISCWMAPESIPIGSNYTKEIPTAISNCKVFLLLLSDNAVRSKWVPLELDRAFNEEKIIIPFVIENCTLTDDFNFMLAKTERINAYYRKSEAFERLVTIIKASIAGNQSTKPFTSAKHNLPKIVTACVAAVLALAVLIGIVLNTIGLSNKNDHRNQTVAPTSVQTDAIQNDETSEGSTEVTSKIGSVGDYVTVGREESYNDPDSGKTEQFRIPKITIDSEDAAQANEEIEEIFAPVLDAVKYSDSSNGCVSLDFDSYLTGEILSVVITSTYFHTNVYKYEVYNFDVTTGNILNNRSLCKKLGTNWEDTKVDLYNALKNSFEDSYPEFIDTEFEYTTLSDDNLDATRLFMGGSKKLCAAATFYIGAGAGSYQKIVEVSSFL